jgi:hypothetical protein
VGYEKLQSVFSVQFVIDFVAGIQVTLKSLFPGMIESDRTTL